MSAYRIMTPAVVRSALLAAGIGLAPGTGFAQEIVPFPPADRLAVVVRAQLAAAAGDSLRLEYEVANSSGSEQAAMAFVVRSLVPSYRVAGPPFWWGSSAVVDDSVAADWFVLDERGLIAPGATQAGFFISALGLPEPVGYRAQGDHFPPEVEEGAPVEDPPSIWTNSVAGITLGPAPFPTDSAPSAVVGRLRALTVNACDVGWIDAGTCDALLAELDAAVQAVGQGNVAGARARVQAVLALASELADEGRALLEPNAQFTLDVLPETGLTAWASGVQHAVGDQVSFESLDYVCRQAHTSQVGWEPPNVYALWARINSGDAWAPQVLYETDDEVVYNGVRYRAIQGHQSQPGWEPPNVPALWAPMS